MGTFCGYAPVAVGATNFAFLYFALDGFPPAITRRQIGKVILLFARHMIKFQHQRVRLPAVNTRVVLQIFEKESRIRFSFQALALAFATFEFIAAIYVNLRINDFLAVFAVRLKPVLTTGRLVEVLV
jgi:hypothetical protein